MTYQRLPFAIALFALAPSALAQCELDELAPPAVVGAERFGVAIAASDEVAVVGTDAYLTFWRIGSAYVFRRVGDRWSLETELPNPHPHPDDQFGRAVALQGDRLFVGSPSAAQLGSVHVYEHDGGSWAHIETLFGSDAGEREWFGYSLAVDGDTLMVGGLAVDGVDHVMAGAVYVFERSGGAWTEVQKITASDELVFDYFGSAICLEGDRALVAAEMKRGPGAFTDDSGQVYVFEREAGTWVEKAAFRGHDTDYRHMFGRRIALAGDTAFVSSWGHPHDPEPYNGSVYVFERLGPDWVETAHLYDPDPGETDEFGGALALSEDGKTAYVGVPGDHWGIDPGGYASAETGTVRVYREIGATWVETNVLHHAPPEWRDSFGWSLELTGNTLLVGIRDYLHAGTVAAWGLGAPDCSLGADSFLVSLAEGSFVNLSLDAGPAYSGRPFWLLGTTAGTEPGLPLQSFVLPLNYDGPGGYLWQTLVSPNSPPLSNSMGILDANGHSQSVFLAPAGSDPALAGLTLHHAYVVFDTLGDQVLFVSNPVHLFLGE